MLGSRSPWSCLLAGELEQLAEFADHLRISALFESSGHAGGQVTFEQRALEGFHSALDSVRLLEDVHAVDVVLNHLAYTPQMTLDRGQAVQNLLFVGLHG